MYHTAAMVDFVRFVEAFCVVAAILHWTSILVVGVRARMTRAPRPQPADAPGVSVVRPVCGLENNIEATLRTTFALTYPRYEVLFCVASERDPVVPLVRSLIAAHPNVPSRFLVGDDRVSVNPKLNNVVKGWEAASYDWIAMTDSNVLMPRDYIEQLLSRTDAETAIASAPPVASDPDGLCAELECAFLNPYQARWQLAADAVGLGFAHGKNMLWRRPVLEAAGGIRALGAEPAEDAAGTKIARARGLKVHLVTRPFPQPLGHRSFGEVWRRQLRWARLRRASFKGFFLPEILSGGFLPLLCLLFLTMDGAVSVLPALACVAAWYGAECALALALRWPLSWRAPLLAVLRDAMLPCLWTVAMCGNEFVWRGTAMDIGTPAAEPEGTLQLAEE
jgi:ceramide glucosyltransferase